jgi:hypothetical protein
MASEHDAGHDGIDGWPSGFREQRPLGTVYPGGEGRYPARHDQVVVAAWEGTPIGVDVEMAPLLTGLWRAGYRTYFSCQGDGGPAIGECEKCGTTTELTPVSFGISDFATAPDATADDLADALEAEVAYLCQACGPAGPMAATGESQWAWISFATQEMAWRFIADFHLEQVAEHRTGDPAVLYPVRFPAGMVQELRRELTRRGALTHWEDIRGIALRKASELEAMFAGHPAVAEAEMAARGYHPVTIAHGTPETSEEQDLMHGLAATAAECGDLAGIRGGNEHTTYLFRGPGAGAAAASFVARVTGAAPHWWRVTATAYPSWHPDE